MYFTRIIHIVFMVLLAIAGLSVRPAYDVSPFSPGSDLALNDRGSAYPHPLESDNGWGGAPYKWHINDGLRLASSYWTYGLAFTGGREEYIDTCGWRQATLNFGRPVKINRTVVWLEHDHFDEYDIQCRDTSTGHWRSMVHVTNKLSVIGHYLKYYKNHQEKIYYRLSIPCEDTFPAIITDKIRFRVNNCQGGHGWINEFEVYHDQPGDRPACMVIRKGCR